MPIGVGGIVCRGCGGSGCSACNSSGWADSYYLSHIHAGKNLYDIVPMPYGKLDYPDLRCSYSYNDADTPEDWVVHCPACSSDHVCCLSPFLNELESAGLWFCISCHDSWRYERER